MARLVSTRDARKQAGNLLKMKLNGIRAQDFGLRKPNSFGAHG